MITFLIALLLIGTAIAAFASIGGVVRKGFGAAVQINRELAAMQPQRAVATRGRPVMAASVRRSVRPVAPIRYAAA
jgi:nitrogen fixation protein FixH